MPPRKVKETEADEPEPTAPEEEQESDERAEEQPPSEDVTLEKTAHESTHIHLEGSGFVEHIDAGHHERTITYNGRNFEHVAEVDGIWSYRQM